MAAKFFDTPVSWFELHFGNSSRRSCEIAMELIARVAKPIAFPGRPFEIDLRAA
jgi:hypothetical protein